VFARAGDNMEFAVPRNSSPYYVPPEGPDPEGVYCLPLTSYTLQGAVGDEDAHEDVPVELVKSSGTYPGDQILFGENMESVRALFQKPSRLYPLLNGNGLQLCRMGVLPLITVVNDSDFDTLWTWFGWLRSMFTGIACSERFKIFTTPESFVGVEPKIFMGTGYDVSERAMIGTLAPMTGTPSLGAEVNVPYYGTGKWVAGWGQTACDLRENIVWNTRGDPMVVYHGAGPDIRVNCFRQIPLVVVSVARLAPADLWFKADDDPASALRAAVGKKNVESRVMTQI